MTRPHVVTVLSTVVASVAAFFLASRWHLYGTFAGAALIPLVHTIVSHWSQAGLERTADVIRRRAGRTPAGPSEAEEVDAISEDPGDAAPDPGSLARPDEAFRETPRPSARSVRAIAPWMLAGAACIALALGVYAAAFREPAERVIVRERVIEQQVEVAVPVDRPAEGAADTSSSAEVGTDTTDTTDTTDPADTTQTTGPDGADEADGDTSPTTVPGGPTTTVTSGTTEPSSPPDGTDPTSSPQEGTTP